MVELPVDYARPGDVLAKNHSFKKYSGGMSSTVDLMKGYKLTQRVLDKLKTEFKAQFLSIQDSSERWREIELEEGFDERARQKIVSAFTETVGNINNSRIIDIRAMESIVHDIIDNVSHAIRNGKGSFRTLSKAFYEVQAHDIYTWEHSVNTAIYAAIIALSVPKILDESKRYAFPATFSKPEILVFNLLLHDVGKIRIPLEVLNKPERLNKREVEVVQKHPYSGFVYLRKINESLQEQHMALIPSYFMKACLLHHQAYDGTGYPPLKINGHDPKPLKLDEISVVGRIAAIADYFDALSSNRPYRLPYHASDALKLALNERGKKLDPEITNIFTQRISPYPIGSTVILSSEELAVVTGYVNNSKFEPIVRPYLKKVRRNGKEAIIRLENRQSIKIVPQSKVQIVLNKNLYKVAE